MVDDCKGKHDPNLAACSAHHAMMVKADKLIDRSICNISISAAVSWDEGIRHLVTRMKLEI